ncbi:MAG: ATP-binding cassette domain-containing protein [Thermoguttaceae bacterium]|nr:ATP-binding cassette domain-containing protein [Thermoguttaceae bacterium]MDW8079212.1 ATP-binding cassette domain-containing protein [Thermoguttaceae bacterium]
MDSSAGRMAVAFTVEDLQYHYPSQDGLILRGLTFTIPLGSKVAIFGRSGVGKSTLLSILGLLWEGELASGRVCYHSLDHGLPWDYRQLTSPEIRASLRLREFGFVFQWSGLLPHLTCEENVALPLILQGWPTSKWRPRVRRLLKLAEHSPGELSELANRLGPFSGGQQRRLALIRGLSHNPPVLFADEPFSNLDSRSVEAVLRLLASWHMGELFPEDPPAPRTLLLASHDIEEAWQLCDHFLILTPEGTLADQRILPKTDLSLDRVKELIDRPSVCHT